MDGFLSVFFFVFTKELNPSLKTIVRAPSSSSSPNLSHMSKGLTDVLSPAGPSFPTSLLHSMSSEKRALRSTRIILFVRTSGNAEDFILEGPIPDQRKMKKVFFISLAGRCLQRHFPAWPRVLKLNAHSFFNSNGRRRSSSSSSPTKIRLIVLMAACDPIDDVEIGLFLIGFVESTTLTLF